MAALLMVAHATVAAAMAPALGCAHEAPPPQQTEMNRDEAYRSARDTLDALRAIWTQQPGNSEALARTTERLKDRIDEIRDSEVGGKAEEPAAAEEASPEARPGQAPAPGGPFPPSERPSAEAERVTRREATERELPAGGPLEAETEVPSLRDVPEEWVAESCRRAGEEIATLEALLDDPAADAEAVESSLERLARILRETADPPEPPPR